MALVVSAGMEVTPVVPSSGTPNHTSPPLSEETALAVVAPREFNSKEPRLIQVTNLSTKASDKQIQELFQQIGEVAYVEIFPKEKNRNKYGNLVGYVEFCDPAHVNISQHLTSTVFIDKPIVVFPVSTIPSEYEVLQLAAAMSTSKQHQLETREAGQIIKQLVHTIAPTIPSHIANPVIGNKPQPNLLVAGLSQTKELCDSSEKVPDNVVIIASTGVPMPKPPRLSEDYNPQKEREARRTVFVDNLNPFLTAEHILNYFQFCGDIRYLRIGGDWMEKRRFAFIEFFDIASVEVALQYDGADFCNMRIRVVFSRHWVGKPPTKQSEAEVAQDLIMQKLRDAQAQIANAVKEDSVPPPDARSPKSKRSPSKSSRRRDRSRDRSKRSRDRSKTTKKKSRQSKDRSKSRERKSSRERNARSKSREKRSKSREKRSKSKDKRSKSRDKRSRSRESKPRDRRSRSRDKRNRRSRDRSRRH